jgi:hypothetical protein
LGITFVAVLALAGCGASGLPMQASYATQMKGKFNDTGEFAANLVFLANYADATFSGTLQNFQFSRRGFERPSGSIPISGTISRTPEGEPMFKGAGEGVLAQGNREYAIGVEMESSYVDPEAETVSAWYFGGGEFTEAGRYVDWPGIAGDFRAEAVCKQYLFSAPCVIPSAGAVALEPES